MMLTVDKIKEYVPEELHPIVDRHGPAIIDMTVDDVKAWAELLVRGDVYSAYKELFDRMRDRGGLSAMVAEDERTLESLRELVDENAERVRRRNQVLLDLSKVGLGILMALI